MEVGTELDAKSCCWPPAGLSNVVRYLRPDAVQFCGFRVALSGDQAAAQPASAEEGSDWQKPFSTGKSVFVCWIGENVRAQCTAAA